MEQFTLEEAVRWTHGVCSHIGSLVIQGVSTDSRKTGAGCLFVPLAGERFDGHDFIQQAAAGGACAVLSRKGVCGAQGVPIIEVGDTGQALLDLACGYRSARKAAVIGVTGSVGKTTTKDLIACVLAEEFETVKTKGNLNNEIGLPLSIFTIEENTQAAVLEMGMNHFGEISRMTATAKPDFAVITNIGVSHIEHLGSREGICKAKLEILEGLKPQGTAILCGDEPLLWEKRESLTCRTVYYGIENPECDLIARNIRSENGRVFFEIYNRSVTGCAELPTGQSMKASLHVVGRHNVANALAAAAAGMLLGQAPGSIAAGLAAFRAEGMRQNVYQKGEITIYADCYNASPDSMEAALAAAKELPGSRRIAALGGMLELGPYHMEGHARVGRAAAGKADLLYLYGDGTQYTAQAARESGMPEVKIKQFETHEALARALRETARAGDVVLFKGSRGMHMEYALEMFLGE